MSVRERESASDSIIVSLLALRADVSILARALFYLFLPFILISHLCSDRILTCRIKSIRSPARWDWLLQI